MLGPVTASSSFNLIGDGTGLTGLAHDVDGNLVGTLDVPLDANFVVSPSWGEDTTWGTEDDLAGDYRLKSNSPAVDSGDSAQVPSELVFDLGGNARIAGQSVDRGAYERSGGAFRITLSPESDSGIYNTDRLTNVTNPMFSLYVSVPGTLTLDFDLDGSADQTETFSTVGNQSITTSIPLPDGLRVVAATLTPDGGNPLTDTVRFQIDTDPIGVESAPETLQAPILDFLITLDEPYDRDRVGNATGTLQLSDGSVVTVQVRSDAGRTIAITASGVVVPGSAVLTLSEGLYDLAGNQLPTTHLDVVVNRDNARPFVTLISPDKPVAGDIDDLVLRFSEEMNLETFQLQHFFIQYPDGSTQNASSVTSHSEGQNEYRVSFVPSITEEGSYQLFVSPDVTDPSSNPIVGNQWESFYSQSFEEPLGDEWDKDGIYYHPDLSRTLGRHSRDSVTLQLSDLPSHQAVRVEWDLVLLDSLGAGSTGWSENDQVKIRDNTRNETVWTHSFSANTPTDIGSWSTPFSGEIIGQRYRNLSTEWSHSSGNLDIDFFDTGFDGIHDESWAIDNVRISLLNANSEFSSPLEIDRTAPRIVDFSPSPTDVVMPPLRSFDVTFSEPIDATSFSTIDVELTNPAGDVIPPPHLKIDQLTKHTYRIVVRTAPLTGLYATGLAGEYKLTINPSITDIAGNQFDQDGSDGNQNAFSTTVNVGALDIGVKTNSVLLTPDDLTTLGRSIAVEWTVENVGPIDVAGSWHDQIYLSSDPILDTNVDSLLATLPSARNSLVVGENYTNTKVVALPDGPEFEAGDYYVFVLSDAYHHIADQDRSNKPGRLVGHQLVDPIAR